MPFLSTAAAIYVLVNVFTFSVFFLDKRSAKRSARRTPEKTLLTFAFIGPFGAAAAMHVFRHKTQKSRFRLVPLFLLLHLAVAIALVLGLV